MNIFMCLVFTLATTLSFVTLGTAAPFPSATVAQLDKTPIKYESSSLIHHVPEHRPKVSNVVTNVYSPFITTITPTPIPISQQTGNDTEDATATASWAETHPTALIALFTFTPITVCILLYPIFRFLARRRAARLDNKANKPERVQLPESPPSPYVNNPRLEPLPTHPEMVYVPPTSKDGSIPIFGHFRTPSGQVYGVADRWLLAKDASVCGVNLDKSSDSQSLFVHPV